MRGTDNREKNLVREFIVDPERVVYDAASGRLVDVSADELKVIGMPGGRAPYNLRIILVYKTDLRD